MSKVHICMLSPFNKGEVSEAVAFDGEKLLRDLVSEPTTWVAVLAGLEYDSWAATEGRLVAELETIAASNSTEHEKKVARNDRVKPQIPAIVPARFRSCKRNKTQCIGRQVIGHDCDHVVAGSFDEACEKVRAQLPARFLAIHTTATERNDDGTWRLRAYELLDREATPEEWESRVKSHMRALGEHDEKALDISRFLYLPVRTPNYGFKIYEGPRTQLDDLPVIESTPTAAAARSKAETPSTSMKATLEALAPAAGKAWAKPGDRHAAKVALAGGFYYAGAQLEDALRFAKEVYKYVDSADGGKLDNESNDITSTYERAAEGKKVTGFPTLAQYVEPLIVKAISDSLRKDGEWVAKTELRADYVRGDAVGNVTAANDAAEPLPDFPVDALPPVLSRFASAVAKSVQVSVDVPAMLSIGACAAAVAGRLDIELLPNWSQSLNMFAVVALKTGERKTPVHKACFGPLYRAEEILQVAQRADTDVAKSKRRAREKRLERLQSEYAGTKREDMALTHANASTKPGGAGIMQEIEQLTRELSTMKVPALPRLVCDDVTEERLAGLMAEQGGRMCVTSSEDTVLQNIAGRYANGRSSFNVFLKGYSGDEPITYDRKKDAEYISVRRPCLSVILTVQPSVIEGLARDRSMRDKGLLGRFLYSVPKSMVGERESDDVPAVPDGVRDDYWRVVQELATIPAPAEKEEIPRIRLSAEARNLHLKLQKWIEPRLKEDGDLAEIVDWANKFCGNVGRIAGVLHCVEHLKQAHAVEVSGQTMYNAIKIGCYLVDHAKAAFGCMGKTDIEADAGLLAGWARRRDRFVKRDVLQFGPRPLRDRKRLGAVLDFLVEAETIKQDGNGWRVAT